MGSITWYAASKAAEFEFLKDAHGRVIPAYSFSQNLIGYQFLAYSSLKNQALYYLCREILLRTANSSDASPQLVSRIVPLGDFTKVLLEGVRAFFEDPSLAHVRSRSNGLICGFDCSDQLSEACNVHAAICELFKQIEVTPTHDAQELRQSLEKQLDRSIFKYLWGPYAWVQVYDHELPKGSIEVNDLDCGSYAFLKLREKRMIAKGLADVAIYDTPLTLLKEWGYKPVGTPQSGDLVVYVGFKDSGQSIIAMHYGVYLGRMLVESKFGLASPVYHHGLFDVPASYGTTVVFYRKTLLN